MEHSTLPHFLFFVVSPTWLFNLEIKREYMSTPIKTAGRICQSQVP